MIHINQKKDCCGCHACLNACPFHCIIMVADSEGFLYPQVDKSVCTDCGLCVKVCPMEMAPSQGESPKAFAAWNRDEAVRADSSSGGVFNALMLRILQHNGVVIGAAFDNAMALRHQSACSELDCQKFRGSKYLQSIIGETYREAKKYLLQGRRVLFSGTPCQIAGLYAYLGKDDDNLLTCDLVCHGVPSPKVFAAYQAMLERRYRGKTQKITFRSKERGWKQYSVVLSFNNGTMHRQKAVNNPFIIGFLRDIYLRPSCHSCRFSRLPRMADISLGDYWGVGDHHPEWDDDKGTSLILIQTEKGRKAFDECRDALVIHEADLSVAIRSNPSICGSVPPGMRRADFFNDLERLPFEKVMKKYMSPPSPWHRFVHLPRRVVGYLLRRIKFMK